MNAAAISGITGPAVRRANSSTSTMPKPAASRSAVFGPAKERSSIPSASRT